MGTLILGGRRWSINRVVYNFVDQPALAPQTGHTHPRRQWIRSVTYHTTMGQRAVLVQGSRPSEREHATARDFATTEDHRAADFIVGTDGDIVQVNDPAFSYTENVGLVNGYSIGVEMEDLGDARLYSVQMSSAAALGAVLTEAFSIQQQVCWVDGKPFLGIIPRLSAEGGSGASCVGAFGHCNSTEERGPGDPNRYIFDALVGEQGFERLNFVSGQDLAVWRERQARLGVPQTGVPGPETVAALKARGYRNGLWSKPPSRAWPVVAGVAAGLGIGLLARELDLL
jgi:hypothetical protein